ncbi:MAG: HigA family addiction module antitoxin [Alphaproteobacteria bacterium]
MKEEFVISGKTNRPPTHPGAILKEDVLPELKLSVTKAAKELHIARQTLHRIMAEEAGVTPEMALRLAKFCGNTPSLWLRLQQNYDLWFAQKRLKAEIATIPTHHVDLHW